jgi:glycosyltransferase involved in cell wall biosynthesis
VNKNLKTQKEITILIPTFQRIKALVVTLTSLCFQEEKNFDIVISDQEDSDALQEDKTIQTIIRLLQLQGIEIKILKNLPRQGMAQQRQFLLEQSESRYSLFLDDDVILESYVIRIMKEGLEKLNCGFIGSAVIGLSYQNDVRPHQQEIEFWKDEILPETIIPGSLYWHRYTLHNAANVFHVQQQLNINSNDPKYYKVAWVGGCVMYQTRMLNDVGGFGFWENLPEEHCGEDVLAQLRVMKKYGGCGILPSGVYHQELSTTIENRKVNAPEYLEI